ncbi:hypothetical protein FNV43_RR10222 [Rhamnella rubrinervis]|uniref:Uncharacterized protein n=1 Tax=Rhamnella rubrinervis TaxID=2594499 RepID=A0A8K0MKJ6_9ROSA|nr:hypothetical protein FNV43_RR10222 [Rhamnella rubrinervis]
MSTARPWNLPEAGASAGPNYSLRFVGTLVASRPLKWSALARFKMYCGSKEIKLEWGKGLAQKPEAEARLQELELEKEKPFAWSRIVFMFYDTRRKCLKRMNEKQASKREAYLWSAVILPSSYHEEVSILLSITYRYLIRTKTSTAEVSDLQDPYIKQF